MSRDSVRLSTQGQMLLFRVWVLFWGEGRDRTSATATYLLRPAQEWDKMKTKDWYTDAQPFNLRHATLPGLEIQPSNYVHDMLLSS